MEGPTPVSALIHAATMVAAGVYMLARVSFLIELSPTAQTVIASIGIITALLAALIATQQDDIKRILAYSTLSQLGYMIMADRARRAGRGDVPSLHARLFQGAPLPRRRRDHPRAASRAGHLEDGRPEQEDEVDFLTFTAGYLALIGMPFFSGFFSKDAILLAAWQQNTHLPARSVHRLPHRVLHDAALRGGVPR